MKIDLTLHLDKSLLSVLKKILREGIRVAESPEVTAFRARVDSALSNIADDIRRLGERATGLSEEDKAALDDVATRLEQVAAITPET